MKVHIKLKSRKQNYKTEQSFVECIKPINVHTVYYLL